VITVNTSAVFFETGTKVGKNLWDSCNTPGWTAQEVLLQGLLPFAVESTPKYSRGRVRTKGMTDLYALLLVLI
jgi:hypothetical protein